MSFVYPIPTAMTGATTAGLTGRVFGGWQNIGVPIIGGGPSPRPSLVESARILVTEEGEASTPVRVVNLPDFPVHDPINVRFPDIVAELQPIEGGLSAYRGDTTNVWVTNSPLATLVRNLLVGRGFGGGGGAGSDRKIQQVSEDGGGSVAFPSHIEFKEGAEVAGISVAIVVSDEGGGKARVLLSSAGDPELKAVSEDGGVSVSGVNEIEVKEGAAASGLSVALDVSDQANGKVRITVGLSGAVTDDDEHVGAVNGDGGDNATDIATLNVEGDGTWTETSVAEEGETATVTVSHKNDATEGTQTDVLASEETSFLWDEWGHCLVHKSFDPNSLGPLEFPT